MSANVGTIEARITANTKPLKTSMNDAKKIMKTNTDAMIKTAQQTAKRVGIALAGIGIVAVKSASDFQETQGKFDTAFRGIEKRAEKTAKALSKSYQLSQNESKKLLSNTGDLLKGFGFTSEKALDLSNSVQELSSDLASYNNLQGGTARASEIMTKALLGERDSLISLGVKISEADVKQEMMRLGTDKLVGTAKMSAQAYATYNLILEQTKDAQGDVERTSSSFANQVKELRGHLSDVSKEIGDTLLPYMTKLITKINDVDFDNITDSKAFKVLNTIVKSTMLIFNKLGLAIGFVVTNLSKIDFSKAFSKEDVARLSDVATGFIGITTLAVVLESILGNSIVVSFFSSAKLFSGIVTTWLRKIVFYSKLYAKSLFNIGVQAKFAAQTQKQSFKGLLRTLLKPMGSLLISVASLGVQLILLIGTVVAFAYAWRKVKENAEPLRKWFKEFFSDLYTWINKAYRGILKMINAMKQFKASEKLKSSKDTIAVSESLINKGKKGGAVSESYFNEVIGRSGVSVEDKDRLREWTKSYSSGGQIMGENLVKISKELKDTSERNIITLKDEIDTRKDLIDGIKDRELKEDIKPVIDKSKDVFKEMIEMVTDIDADMGKLFKKMMAKYTGEISNKAQNYFGSGKQTDFYYESRKYTSDKLIPMPKDKIYGTGVSPSIFSQEGITNERSNKKIIPFPSNFSQAGIVGGMGKVKSDVGNNFRDNMKEFIEGTKNVGNTLVNTLALVNPVAGGLAQMFSGDLVGGIVSVLSESEEFKAFMEILTPILLQVAEIFGKVFVPILELLLPIIQVLIDMFKESIKWTLKLSIFILKGVKLILKSFEWLINGILWLVDQIPFVKVGRVNLTKDTQQGIDKLEDILKSLDENNVTATDKTTEEVKKLTSSLFNVSGAANVDVLRARALQGLAINISLSNNTNTRATITTSGGSSLSRINNLTGTRY